MESLKRCRCGGEPEFNRMFRCFNPAKELVAYSAYCRSCGWVQSEYKPWEEMAKSWDAWVAGDDSGMFYLEWLHKRGKPHET